MPGRCSCSCMGNTTDPAGIQRSTSDSGAAAGRCRPARGRTGPRKQPYTTPSAVDALQDSTPSNIWRLCSCSRDAAAHHAQLPEEGVAVVLCLLRQLGGIKVLVTPCSVDVHIRVGPAGCHSFRGLTLSCSLSFGQSTNPHLKLRTDAQVARVTPAPQATSTGTAGRAKISVGRVVWHASADLAHGALSCRLQRNSGRCARPGSTN